MTMPHRVQLSRRKGWRMPANTVKVSRPSKWGNTFRIGDTAMHTGPDGVKMIDVATAQIAVDLFRQFYELHLGQRPEIMRAALDELRGKNLACWCALDQPCHADVLLDLANR